MAFSTRLLAGVSAAMFVIHVVSSYVRGADPFAHYAGLWLELFGWLAGLCVGLGVFLFLVLRFWSAKIASDGLHGRSYWGRRRMIGWSEAVRVSNMPLEGIPAVRVESARGRDIFFAYLGSQVPMLRIALLESAGAEHPLTLHIAR